MSRDVQGRREHQRSTRPVSPADRPVPASDRTGAPTGGRPAAFDRPRSGRPGAGGATGTDGTTGTGGSRQDRIARHIEDRLLDMLPAAVFATDEQGLVVYWNRQASQMYGHSPVHALGRPLVELTRDSARGEAIEALLDKAGRIGRWEGEYDAHHTDGSLVPVHITLERIEDDVLGFRGIVAVSVDISERRALIESLSFQADHDSLTGLPNRRRLVELMDETLARGGSGDHRIAVLSIDLDDFRTVNDRIGQIGADQLLVLVGDRLSAGLRRDDLLARTGGDEFVICGAGVADLREACGLAERVVRDLGEAFEVAGKHIAVSATVGVAVSDGRTGSEELLRKADAAMYLAKEGGRGRVEPFDDSRRTQRRERRELEADLSRGLAAGEVIAYFQPEVALPGGELVGFEALARWNHPEHGVLTPDRFIEVAEQGRLIEPLGRAILDDACRALAGWHDRAPERDLRMAVNVSAVQLMVPDFAGTVAAAIERYRIRPEQLCLEVTESALAEARTALPVLDELKAVGVAIAIDDFGTGYSSLSRVRRFPIDFLKIDRSFVVDMVTDTPGHSVVAAIVGLAQALSLRTVAEGVETTEQKERLVELGCDLGQGFLWGRPMNEAAATALVLA